MDPTSLIIGFIEDALHFHEDTGCPGDVREKGVCVCVYKNNSSLVSWVLKRFPLQMRETVTGEDNYSPDIYHSAAQSSTASVCSFCFCI